MSGTDHTPRLLIDKIAVTFDDPDPAKVSAIVTTLVSKAKAAFKGADVRRSDTYAAFVTIPIPENDPTKSQKLVLQVGPYDPAWSSYRIEFNPSKVGPEGVADLDLILTSALGIDAATFLSEGNITRLDLAVDLPGITVDDVIVRSRSQRKHAVYSDQKGRPVTAYLGGARSDRTVTYDKPSGSGLPTSLRIKRRVRPKCMGRDLPMLPDPFAKLVLTRTEPLKALLAPVEPIYFFDSARVRGINRAIARLPFA